MVVAHKLSRMISSFENIEREQLEITMVRLMLVTSSASSLKFSRKTSFLESVRRRAIRDHHDQTHAGCFIRKLPRAHSTEHLDRLT
jgi:hypothetical protein